MLTPGGSPGWDFRPLVSCQTQPSGGQSQASPADRTEPTGPAHHTCGIPVAPKTQKLRNPNHNTPDRACQNAHTQRHTNAPQTGGLVACPLGGPLCNQEGAAQGLLPPVPGLHEDSACPQAAGGAPDQGLGPVSGRRVRGH